MNEISPLSLIEGPPAMVCRVLPSMIAPAFTTSFDCVKIASPPRVEPRNATSPVLLISGDDTLNNPAPSRTAMGVPSAITLEGVKIAVTTGLGIDADDANTTVPAL